MGMRLSGRFEERLRRTLFLACLLAIALVAAYRIAVFEPSDKAILALMSDNRVRVSSSSGWWLLEPVQGVRKSPGVIVYPGLLADAAGYSPWARMLAERGYPVYLVKMPLNFSPLATERATRILNEHPQESFVIGGHSLGGAVAARYAAAHRERVKGLFLIASFIDREAGEDVGGMPVLQVAATKDGIVTLNVSDREREQLPGTTEYVNIRGGNHQQFASYAEEWQDYPPAISEAEQLSLTAGALEQWLSRLGPTLSFDKMRLFRK
ncbi:alpha/beta fold hydrolase [Paenibacillus methanolicus]|uniref:Alpha/beta hydrolase family protein n=1 Tax=Paenibacillus methanolicus TaxID=582686 RepID=A0A5S5BYH2_9BACL|nr:alpha/beta fold hydrolase [Paenibacillus methanolicus]TYP71242.1 alpha/beta hydrolase family protein [Paenibacillus methanolicus]